jgi:hypothetical protein
VTKDVAPAPATLAMNRPNSITDALFIFKHHV